MKDLLEKNFLHYETINDMRRNFDRIRFRKKIFIATGIVLAAGIGVAFAIFGTPVWISTVAVYLFTSLRYCITIMATLIVYELKILITRPDLLLELIKKIPFSEKYVFIPSVLSLLMHWYITEIYNRKI